MFIYFGFPVIGSEVPGLFPCAVVEGSSDPKHREPSDPLAFPGESFAIWNQAKSESVNSCWAILTH